MKLATLSRLRPALFCFLLVLPLGYESDVEELAPGTLRVSAGGGEVYGIVQDCSGDELVGGLSQSREAAIDLSWIHKSVPGNRVRIGVRGSWWETPDANSIRPEGAEERAEGGSFVNPYVDFEGATFGFGVGVAVGRFAATFDEILLGDLDMTTVTGHLRVGESGKPQFVVMLGEVQPVTVAGWFNAGLAYPLGPVRLFTGWSARWYDSNGVVQRIEVPLGDRLALDVLGRYGSSAPDDEWGVALGATLLFGR